MAGETPGPVDPQELMADLWRGSRGGVTGGQVVSPRPPARHVGPRVVAVERRVGFGLRAVAWIIDVVLTGAMSMVIALLFGGVLAAVFGGLARWLVAPRALMRRPGPRWSA